MPQMKPIIWSMVFVLLLMSLTIILTSTPSAASPDLTQKTLNSNKKLMKW